MSGRTLLSKMGPLLGLIGVFVFFTVAVWAHTGRNSFATWGNLQTIIIQSAIVGMAALGMTVIIISGGIDLSVGATVAVSSVVVAALLKFSSWPAFPAACGGILVGGLCGLINGTLVTRLHVVPFIITLGTSLMLRGVAELLADEKTINPDSSGLDSLLDQRGVFSPGLWMLALLGAAVSILLHYTRFGRHVTAVGSNEQAARLCGVPINRVKVLVYVLGGLLAGLSGVLQYSRLTIGDPTSGPGLELDVIAAVVIGGGSLLGGEGSVLGSLLGAVIMMMIRSGCSQMGWRNPVTKIVAGAIIIVAVTLDRLRHRKIS